MVQSFEYDVVIVGAGLAGLTVALSLPQNMRVALFLKDDIHVCSSYMAQGGIAAVLAETDTIENHVKIRLQQVQGYVMLKIHNRF